MSSSLFLRLTVQDTSYLPVNIFAEDIYFIFTAKLQVLDVNENEDIPKNITCMSWPTKNCPGVVLVPSNFWMEYFSMNNANVCF